MPDPEYAAITFELNEDNTVLITATGPGEEVQTMTLPSFENVASLRVATSSFISYVQSLPPEEPEPEPEL